MNSPGGASALRAFDSAPQPGTAAFNNLPLLGHRNGAALNRYRVQPPFAYAGLRFEESQDQILIFTLRQPCLKRSEVGRAMGVGARQPRRQ
jgi:hypothetical protein